MPNQDQYIRQDVIAQQDLSIQGNTFLGNDPSDTVTVIGKMVAGGTTTEPVISADYGPGPLTNESDGGLITTDSLMGPSHYNRFGLSPNYSN